MVSNQIHQKLTEVTVLVPAARPAGPQPHSVLDIAPVSLGVLLRPLTTEDDLLSEMLEGRS
jgi:hypothetical protein